MAKERKAVTLRGVATDSEDHALSEFLNRYQDWEIVYLDRYHRAADGHWYWSVVLEREKE